MTDAVRSENDELPAVSVYGLMKRYGSFDAVRAIDFQIGAGEIFGIIGPDGAGKTSTFHVLGAVCEPTDGEVKVFGRSPAEAKSDIGYLTQQFSLHLDLSVMENLRYSASLRQVESGLFEERKNELLKLMGLYRFQDRLAGQLSGGMKQKLALCTALIARPKLLLLDEPTTGVDPVSRRELWDVLATISQEGVTVAVATPYLDEAERCHRVALMFEGSIRSTGSPAQLKESLGLTRIETYCNDVRRMERALRSITGEGRLVSDLQTFGDRLDILTRAAGEVQDQLVDIASNERLEVSTSLQEPTLENVFVHELSSDERSQAELYETSRPDIATGTIAIEARSLSKRFGTFWAVKDVSLTVSAGEIFGLLGANGAGKTTTIKMLCGLLGATRGEMSLCGETKNLRSTRIRKRIGYMSQKFTLYDDLTIGENLSFYCSVYSIPLDRQKERISWALDTCGLKGQESLITGRLPGGWKQRLAFGACVMHEPEILFLDEPTSGVDPLARRQLWDLIRKLASRGTAILVTTHFLEEAEHCHRLAFMASGKVVASGSPESIKAEQPGQLLELKTSDTLHASRLLKTSFADWQVSIFSDQIHFAINEPADLDRARNLLSRNNIQLVSSRVIPFSLEDSFIGIVQRSESKRAS